VKTAISAAMRDVARERRRPMQAIVLTGSLARDEATMVAASGRVRVACDAEFLAARDPRRV
jgi:hypothetical protein